MGNYDTSQFKRDLEEFEIYLSDIQIDQFIIYYEKLIEWNSFMNLTAITQYEDVLKKHFIDSISIVKALDISKCNSVIDVGTGAGFPGLVLKIVFPNLKVILLDSLNKRIKFLDSVIKILKLDNVEAVHGRAEDLASQEKYREKFDVCVSRAVANLSTLSEYCIPFIKKGGYFVSYKSENSLEEINASQRAIAMLGGSIEKQMKFYLPDSDICRRLVVIRKTSGTSAKYPRKAGVPSREPL